MSALTSAFHHQRARWAAALPLQSLLPSHRTRYEWQVVADVIEERVHTYVADLTSDGVNGGIGRADRGIDARAAEFAASTSACPSPTPLSPLLASSCEARVWYSGNPLLQLSGRHRSSSSDDSGLTARWIEAEIWMEAVVDSGALRSEPGVFKSRTAKGGRSGVSTSSSSRGA